MKYLSSLALAFVISHFAAAQTGVCFESVSDYQFATGKGATGVIAIDINLDGKTDIVNANSTDDNISILLGGDFKSSQTKFIAVQSRPTDVVSGDFNGDSKPDLVVANASTPSISLLIGAGDGTFSTAHFPLTGSQRTAAVVADFNGDSKPDVAVAGTGEGNLLLGTGTGFLPVIVIPTSINSTSVSAADVNADGKMDLIFTGASGDNVSVLIGNGQGGFAQPALIPLPYNSPAWDHVSGDLNNDGKADIMTFGYQKMLFLAGNGNGTFAVPVPIDLTDHPRSLAKGDFNQDGKTDLAVSSLGYYMFILLANNSGGFQAVKEFLVGQPNISIAVGDVNNDSKTDIVLSDLSITILDGDGNGNFKTPGIFKTGENPYELLRADFNLDGKIDIATPNQYSSNISVLLNNGAGGLLARNDFDAGQYPASATSDDFNADGKPDLAVANQGSSVVTILLGDGTGAFASHTTIDVGLSPYAVISADFDEDDKIDLVVANTGAGTVTFLKGAGDGDFTPTTFNVGTSPRYIKSADFNLDGHLDLVLSTGNDVTILYGVGDGSFDNAKLVAMGSYTGRLALLDANTDGLTDVVIKNGNRMSLLLNSATGFSTSTKVVEGEELISVTSGDFNMDGKADLAVSKFNPSSLFIYAGNGTGGFSAPVEFKINTGASTLDLIAADINSDGIDDVVALHYDTHNLSLFINNTAHIVADPIEVECASGSVKLSANTNGYAYSWSPSNETGNSITVSSGGDYTVTITNASGNCKTTSKPLSLSFMPATPTAFIKGKQNVCKGGEETFAVPGVSGVIYAWSYSGSGATITSIGSEIKLAVGTNATSGVLSVQTSNACGIADALTMTLTVNETPVKPIVTFNQPAFLLTASAGAASYQWFKNGTSIDGATTATFKVIDPGSYTVVASSAAGCVSPPSDASVVTITGLEDEKSVTEIFPNPASDFITLCALGFEEGVDATLTIIDVLGRVYEASNDPFRKEIRIPLSAYGRGQYILRLQQGQKFGVWMFNRN